VRRQSYRGCLMESKRKKGDDDSFPPDVTTSASEEELLDIAVQYAVDSHGHRDTPALREELRLILQEGRRKRAA